MARARKPVDIADAVRATAGGEALILDALRALSPAERALLKRLLGTLDPVTFTIRYA